MKNLLHFFQNQFPNFAKFQAILKRRSGQGRRGQSFVELALLFPLLLILISGLVEFGLLLNHYLALVDAARNAARFSSDSLYYTRDNVPNCEITRDFYMQTACMALQELAMEDPSIEIDLDRGDDILVSGYTIQGGASPAVSAQHPDADGWSYAEAITGAANQTLHFSNSEVVARLQSNAPSTGVLIVEVYHHYDQVLRLPWITAFLDDPLLLHAYTVMPLVSAEPTPTP